MKSITCEVAKSLHSIETKHEQMPNGELRFRLMSLKGGSYIRTEQNLKGSWQKSHSHRSCMETYIVQEGWIILAFLEKEKLALELLGVNEVKTIKPNQEHNVYMPEKSVIHTVKHGTLIENDWFEEKNLDLEIQNLSEKHILSFIATSQSDFSLIK